MDRKNELLIRVYIVLLIFVIVAFVILFKVFSVGILEGEKWREEGEKNIQMRPIEAERGNIYAEDGSLLATSITFFEIRMDLTTASDRVFRENIDSLAIKLSEFSEGEKSPATWKANLKKARRSKNQYYQLFRQVSFDELKRLKTFPILNRGQYGGGFIAKAKIRRERPFKYLAERTIGKDRVNASKIGLEGYFDKYLSGEELEVPMKKISPGIWIPLYDPQELEPKKGHNIITTLDMHIQDITHEALLSAINYHEAEGGVAIVMEVKTGAIKAISNLKRAKNGKLMEIYNNAIGTLSEPGSTFKLPSVMALMEDGYADLNTLVDLKGGRKKFYDLLMRDSEAHGIRMATMQKAFEISSNVGISTLVNDAYGEGDGKMAFVERLKQFHLHEKTGIEIKGEASPYIKDPIKNEKSWSGTTLPWMSHGYELMLTPLQIASFYNAVANDGRYMKPYLVSEIEMMGETFKEFKPRVLDEQIAKASTIEKAQLLLENVVKRGSAKRLQTEKYNFAGKTGTARIDYAQAGEKKNYNASFAGYFPAEDPVYTCFVLVYQPTVKGFYGGTVAGPVFRKIADYIHASKIEMAKEAEVDEPLAANQLPEQSSGFRSDFQAIFDDINLAYKRETNGRWVVLSPNYEEIKIEKRKIKKNKIPNVVGMGLRDAVYVLENLGLKVRVKGVGKVSRQSIKPGIENKGQTIDLTLG